MKGICTFPSYLHLLSLQLTSPHWPLTWTPRFPPTGTSPRAAAASQPECGPHSLGQTRASKRIKQIKNEYIKHKAHTGPERLAQGKLDERRNRERPKTGQDRGLYAASPKRME